MIFRFATVQDSATLLEIYAQYIETPLPSNVPCPRNKLLPIASTELYRSIPIWYGKTTRVVYWAMRMPTAKWSVPRINGMQNSPSI